MGQLCCGGEAVLCLGEGSQHGGRPRDPCRARWGAFRASVRGGQHLGGIGQETSVEVEEAQELLEFLDCVGPREAAEGLHLGGQWGDALMCVTCSLRGLLATRMLSL